MIPLHAFRSDILKNRIPGKLMFLKMAGSHSYNLSTPESDVDFFGVYAAKTNSVLGLCPPPATITGEKPDFTIHEVGKFCLLLLKGNPTIVEALFTERFTISEMDAWTYLTTIRDKFLSRRVVRQYLGYCQGQIHKLAAHGGTGGLHTAGGKYSSKWAYHIIRLAWQARDIAMGREPRPWMEGGERDILMKIRAGEWSQQQVEDTARLIISGIDLKKPWPLPDEGNDVLLNAWLLNVREAMWEPRNRV